MNQILVAGLVAAGLTTAGFATGWKVNSWRHDSQQLAIEQAAEQAGAAAADAAVAAIQAIDIKRVTIRQELEREIHYAPVVGPECDITDGVFDALNKGLAGEGTGGTGVPGPDAAAGQEPR